MTDIPFESFPRFRSKKERKGMERSLLGKRFVEILRVMEQLGESSHGRDLQLQELPSFDNVSESVPPNKVVGKIWEYPFNSESQTVQAVVTNRDGLSYLSAIADFIGSPGAEIIGYIGFSKNNVAGFFNGILALTSDRTIKARVECAVDDTRKDKEVQELKNDIFRFAKDCGLESIWEQHNQLADREARRDYSIDLNDQNGRLLQTALNDWLELDKA